MEQHVTCYECDRIGLSPWAACQCGRKVFCFTCQSVREPTCPNCQSGPVVLNLRSLECLARDYNVEMECTYPGCSFELEVGEDQHASEHFQTCEHRIVRCYFESGCTWTGTFAASFEHYREDHDSGNEDNMNTVVPWEQVPGTFEVAVKLEDRFNRDVAHYFKTEDGECALLITNIMFSQQLEGSVELLEFFHFLVALDANGRLMQSDAATKAFKVKIIDRERKFQVRPRTLTEELLFWKGCQLVVFDLAIPTSNRLFLVAPPTNLMTMQVSNKGPLPEPAKKRARKDHV